MRKAWFLIILFFIIVVYTHHHPFASTTYNCQTVADVYIDEYTPDENFNDKIVVLISYNPSKGTARGLFKFDIPVDLEAYQIDTATLLVSGSHHTGGGYAIDIYCYALNVPFDESNDTWNTLSGGDYDDSVVSPGTLPEGHDWESSIDVTALVKGNLNKVREYGILIKLQAEGQVDTHQKVASRESTDPEDFPAYIEIVYSDSTSSTTTTTSVPTLCPVEEIYGERSEETELMRYLRDNVLSPTPEGQEIIRLYYEWSPAIVQMINKDEPFRKEVKQIIDGVLQLIMGVVE
jgi:hypothetical protein